MNPSTVNVLQMSIGFMFVLFSFDTQSFIEQTVINTKHKQTGITKQAGYYSLALVYGFFTVGNFIAPPVVNRLKARWSMALSALTFAIFHACFFFLNEACLYLSSALLGLGSAIFWTAQGKYLAMNSTPETATKHSSMFWGISRGCVAMGGIFLFIVFRNAGRNDEITDKKIHILYAAFVVFTLVGVVLLALLRMPSEKVDCVESKGMKRLPVVSTKEILSSTYNLLKTKRMFFLIFAFMYTGIELSFWTGIYNTCISFTAQLGMNTKRLIAFNAMSEGLGQGLAGILFGVVFTKKFSRIQIILLGSVVHLCAFALIYLNFPHEAPLGETNSTASFHPSIYVALFCGFLLGFGDSCWNSQVFAFLVDQYNEQSTEAFALLKFFQSLLTCAAFFYGSAIELQWHLLILIVSMMVGGFGFLMAERLSVIEIEHPYCQKISTVA
uniref:UNC93-like protein MFSD11 n=1 Tax=Panagrellus redivivus TaxID=6233 RepID=A0A7E4VEN0_PANRE